MTNNRSNVAITINCRRSQCASFATAPLGVQAQRINRDRVSVCFALQWLAKQTMQATEEAMGSGSRVKDTYPRWWAVITTSKSTCWPSTYVARMGPGTFQLCTESVAALPHMPTRYWPLAFTACVPPIARHCLQLQRYWKKIDHHQSSVFGVTCIPVEHT
jgi:hypothetical protein